MRLPAIVLDARVTAHPIDPARFTAGGDVFLDPIEQLPAHVEERTTLRLDERQRSDTYGTPITVNAQVITQLDAQLPVGSKIDLPSGRTVTVTSLALRTGGPAVPEHAEHWGV